MLADQVVHPVPAVGQLGEQVQVVQGLQAAAGGGQAGAVQGGGSVAVDVGAGVQPEPPEQPLLIWGQVGIRQVERGGDRQVLGGHQLQPVLRRRQLGGPLGHGPGGMMVQLACQHPDRQRQVPAQPGDLSDRRVCRAEPGRAASRTSRPAASPGGRMSRLIVSRRPARSGGDGWSPAPGSRRCPAAAGVPARCWPHHRAPAAAACLPASPATAPSVPRRRAGSVRPDPRRQQQAGQRVAWVDRLLSRACARAAAGRSGRRGSSRPAGARRAPRRSSCRPRPCRRSRGCPPPRHSRHAGQRPHQLGELGLAAGEGADIPRQRPGRRGLGSRAWPCRPQHLCRRPRRGPPPRTAPGPASKAQRIRQQPGRLPARGPVDAPLQVTDRPRAQARRLRQLLLRQPCISAQPPQQPREPQTRLLRHRPQPPRNLRPQSPARHGRDPSQLRRPGQPSHPASTGQLSPPGKLRLSGIRPARAELAQPLPHRQSAPGSSSGRTGMSRQRRSNHVGSHVGHQVW